MILQDLVILGTGGVGKFLRYAVSEINDHSPQLNLNGFLEDDTSKHGSDVLGFEVLGGLEWLADRKEVSVAVAIADPTLRKKAVLRLIDLGHRNFPAIIHPTSWLAPTVSVGRGSIIYPGVTINFGAVVGDFNIVNLQCAIGHEVCLGDFVTLSPNVSLGGATKLGDGVFMGIGSATIQGLEIGDWTTIGGGAMVVRNVPSGVTAMGVPARIRDVKQNTT